MKPNDQIRRLTRLLFFSGTVNILLLSAIFYWYISEHPPVPYYELKPSTKKEAEIPLVFDPTNADVLRTLRTLSFEHLITKLTQLQQVENGYTMRDLALASLIAFHQFDLSRALDHSTLPAQRRKISIGQHRDGSSAEITVFPGLSESQFQRIIDFANREAWPLTSKGLFVKLKRQYQKEKIIDLSLAETFYTTPEFRVVERLFGRSETAILKEELLKVLLEGSWIGLTAFLQQQRTQQDLSPTKRQDFLMSYVEQDSPLAAQLLLKISGDVAMRKLTDRQVLAILKLINEKTPEAHQFVLNQLNSPRSDEVWKTAAQQLYQYEGEPFPERFQRERVLAQFSQNHNNLRRAVNPVNTVNIPTQRLYVVQTGDSLWKISRSFKVDVQEIKKANQLKNDSLQPGITLQIPG